MWASILKNILSDYLILMYYLYRNRISVSQITTDIFVCCNHNPILFSLMTYLSFGLTWQVPHVEQELLSFPEHFSSLLVFNGVRVTLSLVICVVFCRPLFALFLLVIALSVLSIMASDNSFGIFKIYFI